jgi:hypothetical protein
MIMSNKHVEEIVKTEGYLIFRVENGRLEDFGLYETYAAAKERIAAAGLAADWKIATIHCYLRARTPTPRRFAR